MVANNQMPVFAAIDIGSNAGRLLISNVYKLNNRVIADKVNLARIPLQLGHDVFNTGYISEEKIKSIIKTFKTYQRLMEIYQPISFVACATAAMRDAENSQLVIDEILKETGITLKIISGVQEAKLISCAYNTRIKNNFERSVYIDVGGGSTEISLFENGEFISCESFKIGTIRLLYDLIEKSEWDKLKACVENYLPEGKEANCICSGGNINKLTKLFGNATKNTLTYSQLSEGHYLLEGYSMEDRMEKMELRHDRADVIVPAAVIFKRIMKWGHIHELQAPKIGLADGLVVEQYKQFHNLPNQLP